METVRELHARSERMLDLAIAREHAGYQDRHMRWGERLEVIAAEKGWDYVPRELELKTERVRSNRDDK